MNTPSNDVNRKHGWLEHLFLPRWVKVVMLLLGVPMLVVLVVGLGLLIRFCIDRPVEYAAIGEHFKYGSTGGERVSGLPYWIFRAMPVVCAEHLPGPGLSRLDCCTRRTTTCRSVCHGDSTRAFRKRS